MATEPRKPRARTAAKAYEHAHAGRKPEPPAGGFGLNVGSPEAGTAADADALPAGFTLDLASLLHGTAGPVPARSGDDHDMNLVEVIDPQELRLAASRLIRDAERDEESRADLDDLIARAIRNLGFDRRSDIRSDYMEGGSGVVHPMMAMAAVDFAARAMREIFPPSGPVKTEILGYDTNPEPRAKAERVKKMMNYQTTRGSPEWRPSVDEMCMRFPIVGTAISKITQDFVRRRPRRENVGILDFICPLGTDDLERAPRYAHRMRYWDTEVQALIRQGFWADVPLSRPTPEIDEQSNARDAERKVIGEEASVASYEGDVKREILEFHVDWCWESHQERGEADGAPEPDGIALPIDGDLEAPGVEDEYTVPDIAEGDGVVFAGGDTDVRPSVGVRDDGPLLPYIVTIDRQSKSVLSVRRNWKKDDPDRKKMIYFKTRAFFPWSGIFGVGLFHLIGGLNVAATGALRALLDSAMVNNMPGGVRLRGSKGTGGRTQVSPMSFAEIDGPPGADDIRKVLMPMPFNPPSDVLFSLMKEIVSIGTSFASVATQDLPTNAAEMAVGTMYAMIEQVGAVYSSVHERMHFAQASELELLHDLNGEYLDDTATARDFGNDIIAYRADFDGSVNVLPVSDPQIFSQLQRSAKAQATLQLAKESKADGVPVDMRAAYLNIAQTLNIQDIDTIWPEPEQAMPLDPVSEVAALLSGKPTQAFPGQAHEAHITFLRATVADPQYAKLMAGIAPAVTALAASHSALQRREEIEQALGMPLPPPGAQMDPRMAAALAQAAAQTAVQMAQTRPAPEEMGGAGQSGAMDQAALLTAQAQMKLADAEIAKVEATREKTASEARIRQIELLAERENLDAELAAKLQEIAAELRADRERENMKVASAERIATAKVAVDVAKMRQPKPVVMPPGGRNGGGTVQ